MLLASLESHEHIQISEQCHWQRLCAGSRRTHADSFAVWIASSVYTRFVPPFSVFFRLPLAVRQGAELVMVVPLAGIEKASPSRFQLPSVFFPGVRLYLLGSLFHRQVIHVVALGGSIAGVCSFRRFREHHLMAVRGLFLSR